MGRTTSSARSAPPGERIDLDLHPEAELFSSEEHPSLTRVLLAGLECFADLGYHGTATRDIARRAGISAGGLYTHFDSKQSILQTISQVTHAAGLAKMLDSAQAEQTAVEQLRALVTVHASFHARYPTAARVANYELHSLAPDARAEMQKFRRGMEKLIYETLDAGQVSGEFGMIDAKIFSKFILSSGIDISRWFRPGGSLGPEALGAQYADFVLHAARASLSSSVTTNPSRAPRMPRTSTSAKRNKSGRTVV